MITFLGQPSVTRYRSLRRRKEKATSANHSRRLEGCETDLDLYDGDAGLNNVPDKYLLNNFEWETKFVVRRPEQPTPSKTKTRSQR